MNRLVHAGILALLAAPVAARSEVLVRWREGVPPPRAELGVSAVAVAADAARVRAALERGYRVYLESDAARAAEVAAAAHALGAAGVAIVGAGPVPKGLPATVIQVDDSGKWPRIRSNVRVRGSQVVQSASRTAQPWLDSNVAAIRILQAAGRRPVLTYPWKPATVGATPSMPSADDLALAVAEAGAFDADLLVDLDAGLVQAWSGARSTLDFYARKAVRGRPISDVAVVTRDPGAWYEVLNLLARHNVLYRIVQALDPGAASDLDLAVVTDAGLGAGGLAEERVVRPGSDAADPNAFALKVWNRVGPRRRPVDIWNGITVLVGLERDGERALRLELVNYGAQPIPIQARVRGTHGRIVYTTPERAAQSLPLEHLDGYTEFVVPEIRIGGTVVLEPK